MKLDTGRRSNAQALWPPQASAAQCFLCRSLAISMPEFGQRCKPRAPCLPCDRWSRCLTRHRSVSAEESAGIHIGVFMLLQAFTASPARYQDQVALEAKAKRR
jgi:hypothetical protein